MYRIDLPFTDGHLLLLPRLGSMPRFGQLCILAIVLGLLLFLVFRIYSYELRFTSKRPARALFALRMGIIALIFIVVGLKPSMRYVAYQTIPSHVLIALDRSDSMGIADPQRDPIEKLELARGLKLVRDLADDAQINAWIEQLRNLNPPTSGTYQRVIERIDALPRKGFAERVLSPEGLALIQSLRERHKLEIVGFSQQLGPLPGNIESIRAILNSDGKTPGESYTDLKLPLKRALEMREEYKEGLVGVVILSDGQHNWGGAPGELAHQLGHTDNKLGVPVYTVVTGARVPPPDLAIVFVKATPPIVFKHGSASIDIRMLANNLPEGKIKITVAYPDAPELPNRKPVIEYVDYDGVNQPAPRSIPVKMDRAATERLTVTVEMIAKNGEKVDERFTENNKRDVVVNVAPDKAKVLVIDGEARWELHYLHTALMRDETMETKSVVFDQPRIGAVKDEDLAQMKLPDLKLPGPDDLPRNDCIILGDVGPEQLPVDERSRLEKFVADRGGTLVILAGKRSMPLEFLKKGDPLGRMLPIVNPRVVNKPDGFQATLTGEGTQTGFLRLEADAGSSQERWSTLPPHYWAVVGKAKEGAAVLAFVPTGERSNLVEQERANALIVRQNYGFGRVVYVGLDSTWRWRFKQGDKYHHRFWSQVIRWAASDRALIAGNEHVRFGIREPVYRSDQEIEMIVRLGDKVKKLDVNSLAGARLYRKTKPGGPEEAIALTPLKPHTEVPGELDGAQSNLPPGDYAMELVIPDIEEKLNGPDGKKLRASFKVLAPDTGEMLNLATNWERMKEIAQKSGGEMYSADKAGELVEKLKARTARREMTTDKHLWQSWWLLIPILLLITVEWGMRKWVGLA